MYYVEFQGDKITGKGACPDGAIMAENQMGVSIDVYGELYRLPADFDITPEGEIINIVCSSEPEPEPQTKSEIEILKEQLRSTQAAVDFILMFY